MANKDLGRVASEQALVDEARSGLHPSGFDLSRMSDREKAQAIRSMAWEICYANYLKSHPGETYRAERHATTGWPMWSLEAEAAFEADKLPPKASVPRADDWIFTDATPPTIARSRVIFALGRFGDVYGPLPFELFTEDAWRGRMLHGSHDLVAYAPGYIRWREAFPLVASAIEARRAAALDAVHESAGPQDDAQGDPA